VLDEVNNDKSDDFADFDDDEDALDPADEQRALLSLFETDCHDRAAQRLMAAERQAHQEARDMWQRSRRGTADTTDDMDLMARVEAGTLHAQHRQEAAAAAAFVEDAAARAEVHALAEAVAEAACARPMQAQAEAKETEDAA
jgi:hypothetical protein